MTIARTSRAAFDHIEPRRGTCCARVFDFIASHGFHGATIEEVATALDMAVVTTCGRVNDLHTTRIYKKPLICDSGRTRTTKGGRQAIVWINAGEAP